MPDRACLALPPPHPSSAPLLLSCRVGRDLTDREVEIKPEPAAEGDQQEQQQDGSNTAEVKTEVKAEVKAE